MKGKREMDLAPEPAGDMIAKEAEHMGPRRKAREVFSRKSVGVFVAAAVIAVCGLAAAAPPRWIHIERDARGVPFSYDANSVSRPAGAGDTVRVEVKASFAEAETPVEGMEEYSYCRKEVEINCLREEYRVTESALYDREGDLSSSSCPFPRSWESVGSSLIMQKLHETLCGTGRIKTMPGWK